MPAELFIGLMTGTSMDAIDTVLVEFLDRNGASSGSVATRVVARDALAMPDELRTALTAITADTGIDRILELDVRLGDLFAKAVDRLLSAAGLPPSRIRAIGSHGQTVLHHPQPPWPRTLQIGDPARLAERSGICTVADFRRRDLAAGGQGAPLAPAFHQALFGSAGQPRLVVNIGGMANLSVLAADPEGFPIGFDTGPGNVLMDIWCQRQLGQPFDGDGAWAASGVVNDTLLQHLLADPYFRQPPPKSTGRDRYNADWLDRVLASHPDCTPATVQASLCELTAVTIAEAARRHEPATAKVLICGGGARNRYLLERLQVHLTPREVATTACESIDPWLVEPIGFAWLARELLAGRRAGPHHATGATRPVPLGAIHPAG